MAASGVGEHRKTILFITHDMDEALFLSDRVLVARETPVTELKELTVPLPRPRTYETVMGKLISLKRQALELLGRQSAIRLGEEANEAPIVCWYARRLIILLLAGLGSRSDMASHSSLYYPKLSAVLISMWDNRVQLGKHFAITLGESLLGLTMSVTLGTFAAIWIEVSSLAKKMLYPIIVASQTIPIIALSPIMVMWFGYEIWSKVAVVILFTFFPIAVKHGGRLPYGRSGIGEVMRTMGARRRDLFSKWKLPSALPGFFTG